MLGQHFILCVFLWNYPATENFFTLGFLQGRFWKRRIYSTNHLAEKSNVSEIWPTEVLARNPESHNVCELLKVVWSLFTKWAHSSWMTNLLRIWVQQASTLSSRAKLPVSKCHVWSWGPGSPDPKLLGLSRLPLLSPLTSPMLEYTLHRFGSPITNVLPVASPFSHQWPGNT